MKDDKPTLFDDPCLPGRCPVWPSNLRISGSFSNDDEDATRPIGLNPADSVGGSNPLQRETVQTHLTNLGNTRDDNRLVFREVRLNDLELTSIISLQDFKHLQVVRLRNNKLKSLHPLGLLSFLSVLDAANNEIESVEDLMPNARLEVVDLSNNCITYFGDWSFNPRLRILKLGGNLLTSLRGDISRNVFLRHLDLSNNRLTRLAELPSTLFVEELLVANNRLTSLEGLESFGQLTTLDVHGNLLKWLHPVCAETHPHLMYVDVGANPEFGDVRLLTPLAGSRLLCSINLFPGPFEEVKWLRIKIIHMLTHLEFLNGEPVTSEEKVEVEEVYGAELSEQRQVWERLLPGEAFLDRRVLKAHELN